MTYTPGWFATDAGRAYCKLPRAMRRWPDRYVPSEANHKVVAVEPCAAEEWVYDLIDVQPTGNFAAGSVFLHNSLHAVEYDRRGLWIAHTWDLPPQQVTWEACAVYMDEAHLIIDSLDYWRKKRPEAMKALRIADMIDAVNDVSPIEVRA